MSLAALFWQKRRCPRTSESAQCTLSKNSMKCGQGQFPINMEDFFRSSNKNFDPRNTVPKFPKTQSTIGENASPKRYLSSLDPVVKHASLLFALSSLGYALNLFCTIIAQGLVSPLGECSSPPVLSLLWVLPAISPHTPFLRVLWVLWVSAPTPLEFWFHWVLLIGFSSEFFWVIYINHHILYLNSAFFGIFKIFDLLWRTKPPF